ncbi:zf-HC2 domain-containing protein [Rugosimonospora africana]|uniref:Membrane protein n=1 Tax=Rugosimonospora africana TaxID=556532 RepID=A0A8J3VPR1_9ACTN|nr:zf-HC2 domain-containing protein [Rugosimonospora africana]GIH14217.1 membrane protein [Rugosimonospora africana]
MGCGQWREALSARLDGEEDADQAPLVDAHLAGCAECRQWFEDAAAVTRLARLGPVASVPGVPDSVLDAVPRGRRTHWAAALRVALGAIGAGQVLLGVAQMAGPGMVGATMAGAMADGRMEGASLDHLAHESAAWNLAVGAGFLFIAWRRSRPAGVVPTLTAFVGVLTAMSLGDLIDGTVAASRLASHVLLLVGYAIVVAMCRPSLNQDPPVGAGRRRDRSRWRQDPPRENVVELRPGGGAPGAREARARDRGVA